MVRRKQGGAHERAIERSFGRTCGWLTTNLREMRQRAGVTQQELAERAGVATTYVARLESAHEPVNVTLRLLVALALAAGCSPHELLMPAEQPRPRPPGRPRSARPPSRARSKR